MFIAQVNFYRKGLTLRHIDLKDEELVDNIEARRDSLFRPDSSSIMKVSLDLCWVWGQLNTLIIQVEDVAFQLLVILFLHLCATIDN